jgi:hypothetical protein
MPDDHLWDYLALWDAVEQAADRLVRTDIEDAHFAADVSNLHAALQACAWRDVVHARALCEDLEAVVPGSSPAAYRNVVEQSKVAAERSKELVLRGLVTAERVTRLLRSKKWRR